MRPRIGLPMAAWATLATLTLLTSACGDGAAQPSTGASGAPVTVRLGIVKASACAPTTGWEKHLPAGSKVVTTYFTAPADQVTALLAGSIDVACTGLTIAIVANAQQQPIRVVSQIATKGTGVIVGKDGGITSVAGLRGKKIGYPANSIHDVIARELLTGAGMNPGTDVTLVKLGLADMPAALCNKQVDAFVGNEPNSSVAILRGCGTSLLAPYDTPIGTINAGILTTQQLVDGKPELLRAVVKAHAAAVDEVVANPATVADVAASWGSDKAAVTKSLDNLAFAWRLDGSFVSNYQELADQLKAIGMVTTAVDVKPIVVDTFAKAVTGSGGS